MSQIGQKKCLQLKKVKNIVLSTYVISDLNVEVIVGAFYKKEFQEINQLESRVEKVIKRKGDNLYVKWKGYKIVLNSYFPKTKPLEGNVKVELDLNKVPNHLGSL